MASMVFDQKKGTCRIAVMLHPSPGSAGITTRQFINVPPLIHDRADKCKEVIQYLADCVEKGDEPSSDVCSWIDRQPKSFVKRLEKKGLLSETVDDNNITFRQLEKHFFAAKEDSQYGTIISFQQAARNFREVFGRDVLIHRIKKQDVEMFVESISQTLASNTVAVRTRNLRHMFKLALQRKWVLVNPFDGFKVKTDPSVSKVRYIPGSVVASIISSFDEFPDIQMAVALSRFGGIWYPSESAWITWGDVDTDNWTEIRIKKSTGKKPRTVPILPDLRIFLQSRYCGENGHLLSENRHNHRNLSTTFIRKLKQIGIEPWPQLFRNLWKSFEDDLISGTGNIVTTANWLGYNAESIAKTAEIREHVRSSRVVS